jgi:hypothetical protein
MSRVNLARILELADAVEAFGNRFNFRRYTTDWRGEPNKCGTTACAVGLAVEKWGAECGVKFRSFRYVVRGECCVMPALSTTSDSPLGAARAMFGELSASDFDVLFTPSLLKGGLHGDATAKEWAEHARRWVAAFQEVS